MNILIFSKNRSMQLEALLRSMKKNLSEFDSSNISVIWKADKGYASGYTKVKNLYPSVNFIMEKSGEFKQQTLECMSESNTEILTMFLVDDIIFKLPFSFMDKPFTDMQYLSNHKYLCVSLRLDPSITHCYATNKSQQPPSTLPVWNWKEHQGDWGYPMSLDGNVYMTSFIKKIVRSLEFSNPNDLEAKLDNFARTNSQIMHYAMLCYDRSKLLNVPANRVQHVYQNRSEESFDTKTLNDLFCKENKVIDIRDFAGINNRSCHHPMTYTFVEREEES